MRDRRGIQLVNLEKGTAHQLMLSSVPVQYTDLRSLQLIYDEKSHETSLCTLFYEPYPSHAGQIDTSGSADREGNKPLLCLYTFNREFQSGLISLLANQRENRTVF